MKFRSLVMATAVAAVLVIGSVAQAVPINGEIAFGGSGSEVGAANWFGSTGVNYTNPWVVTFTAGDFAFPAGTPATFTDFNWGMANGSPLALPLAQTMWTVTVGPVTYQLAAGTITGITRSAVPDGIIIDGIGTLTIVGSPITYDPTPGFWNASFGTTGTGGVPNLSFSTDTDIQNGPEPVTLLLFGAGLLGLAARRRNR